MPTEGERAQGALLIEFDAIMEAEEFSVELTGFVIAEIDTMQVKFGDGEDREEADPVDMLPELPVKPVI